MTPAASALAPPVPETLWDRLGDFVAANLGLHFPPSRRADLRRGFSAAAAAFGFDDVEACLHWLLAQAPTPARLAVLAGHLTIGETYFFRDQPALDALASGVLGPLIEARRHQGRRLRLWSAGCSTGEEAYTLAILLHRLLPDLAQWDVSVLATDVNGEALRRAEAATYGEWSFRGAPSWLKPRYFMASGPDEGGGTAAAAVLGQGGRYTVIPAIRDMVRFGYHNLATPEGAPGVAPGPDTGGMDVVLCRHVLMYFEPSLLPAAVAHLRSCLRDTGWLATSPSEASRALFPGFAAVEFPGAILFRREEAAAAGHVPAFSLPVAPLLPVAQPAVVPRAEAGPQEVLLQEAQKEAQKEARKETQTQARTQARALADQGRFVDALRWCDQWLADDKLAAGAHHLRAMVLIEQGERDAARSALQKALYLVPGFVLAHFALGQLDLQRGAEDAARRHFARAEHALRGLAPDELVPESDGLTAGALAHTLRQLAAQRAVP
ncbi:MAG: CheR family methyltransferase [Pseudomonadota bacterium]